MTSNHVGNPDPRRSALPDYELPGSISRQIRVVGFIEALHSEAEHIWPELTGEPFAEFAALAATNDPQAVYAWMADNDIFTRGYGTLWPSPPEGWESPVRKWAKKYGIDVPDVCNYVAVLLQEWHTRHVRSGYDPARDPNAMNHPMWLVSLRNGDPPAFRVECAGWRPEAEPWANFARRAEMAQRAALFAYREQALWRAKAQGFTPVRIKYKERHYRWSVRHQVLHESYDTIADREDSGEFVSSQAVGDAVRSLAGELGLALWDGRTAKRHKRRMH